MAVFIICQSKNVDYLHRITITKMAITDNNDQSVSGLYLYTDTKVICQITHNTSH